MISERSNSKKSGSDKDLNKNRSRKGDEQPEANDGEELLHQNVSAQQTPSSAEAVPLAPTNFLAPKVLSGNLNGGTSNSGSGNPHQQLSQGHTPSSKRRIVLDPIEEQTTTQNAIGGQE
jgi:hypothetical protein